MPNLIRDFEFKFDKSAEAGTFSGYGAIFGNVDAYGDVIEPGAFKNSLKEWKAKGKLPKMLLEHGGYFGSAQDGIPVGSYTHMEEDSKGLAFEGKLFALNTERGTYIYEGLKSGDLDGMSIGYRAKRFIAGTKAGEPRRRLQEVDLRELSIVTFGANDKALVSDVKSVDIDTITSLSDAETFLREAGGFGMSKKAARDFVSRITKIARREAGDDQDVSGLLAAVKSARRQISP